MRGARMPVEWERIPDGLPEDFRALDGDEIVGRVYEIPHGPQAVKVCARAHWLGQRPWSAWASYSSQ
jgi:hypothetical protein